MPQGRVPLRTNSRSAVKLRAARHCLLEAALFEPGEFGRRLGSAKAASRVKVG